ncbi:MAG: hypothetical protein JSR59_14945 [Proteobacteria bacterium]|nr:hypothetical protein [Pseudomonadota bacterium]
MTIVPSRAASDLTSTRSAQQRIDALLESSNAASASVAQPREEIGSARRFTTLAELVSKFQLERRGDAAAVPAAA